MMLQLQKDIEICLESHARRLHLDIAILIGLAMTESSFRWDATRYEKNYRWLWDVRGNKPFRKLTEKEAASDTPPADFLGIKGVTTAKEEWTNQRTSFGPIQIMGAVARELGFKGRFTELGRHAGIEYGLKHFKKLFNRFHEEHDMVGVISAYNCGRPAPDLNPAYVSKVLTYAAQYKNRVGG
jgi:hypothetical protein